ncbi:hypothetical protein JHL17_07875 [Azospirillum sp. YIM B02556]|uniref:Uncharacterized protein n=1 Tax=Azospirillum endophyticum TaxID=2800326 RepID=A0ABS1F1N0_9PROT|nr:hypothetical protein [Azospirillum endophyticum]MBK1837329.1 hypothetical protein [Azospirillum endophyticum]
MPDSEIGDLGNKSSVLNDESPAKGKESDLPTINDEASEINNFARTAFSSLVQWYCFFFTFSFAALGFYLPLIEKDFIKKSSTGYVVPLSFILMNSISLVALRILHFYILDVKNRSLKIQEYVGGNYRSPFPYRVWNTILILMSTSFFVSIFLWFYLIYLRYIP